MEIILGGYYSYSYEHGGVHSGNCTIIRLTKSHATFKPDFAKENTKRREKVTFGEPR